MNLFSGLNNLNDISLDAKYADICGYTQLELWSSFTNYLTGVNPDTLKTWYNGYNFGGSTVQNSGVIVDDSNNVTGLNSLVVKSQKLWAGLAGDLHTVGLGQFTLASTTSATQCTAMGYNTLTGVTTGGDNSMFGHGAGAVLVSGSSNSGFGSGSLANCTNNSNSGFGTSSLGSVTSGGYMVGIGQSAGGSVATGNYNIFVGFNASSNSTSPTGVIAIGANAVAVKETGSTSGTDGPGIAIGSSSQHVGFRGDGSIFSAVGASAGYWQVKINGTPYKIQLFAVS